MAKRTQSNLYVSYKLKYLDEIPNYDEPWSQTKSLTFLTYYCKVPTFYFYVLVCENKLKLCSFTKFYLDDFSTFLKKNDLFSNRVTKFYVNSCFSIKSV